MKTYLKNLVLTLIAFFLLSACQGEQDYKTVRQDVLDQHDKIMMDGEKAMKYKMELDTLAMSGLAKLKKMQPALDTATERQQIVALTKKLNQADDLMNDWMHNFKTDVDGKSNAEAVTYFNGEKTKVQQLDSTYNSVLKEAEAYLKKLNLQPDTSMKQMDHMHM